DLKTLQEQDKINDQLQEKPFRFGYEHQVSLDLKDGTWNILKDGSKVWLLNVKSKGAKTLNFMFDEFLLPEGAKLYFYNDKKTDLLGAYTSSQNRADMQFGSWLIDGDNIWVEYYEPKNV
ncbi:secretion system protein Por, partial [Aquimarina celericrescens]|nr:secretion system protein Por [Aquimarina celericrescens]